MKPNQPPVQQSLFSVAAEPALARKSNSGAVFSPCRRYRYLLWRRWSPAPQMVICGVNPSDASEEDNDHTVTRGMFYARREGCGAVYFVNPFALVTPEPDVMKRHSHPIEPPDDAGRCNRAIVEALDGAALFVAAWGTHGAHRGRDVDVLALVREAVRGRVPIKCFGMTKDGSPKHPARLGNAVPLIDYIGRFDAHV